MSYMPDTPVGLGGRSRYYPAKGFSFMALLGLGEDPNKEAFVPTYTDPVAKAVAPVVAGNAPDRATKAGKKAGKSVTAGGVMSKVTKNLPLIGVGVTLLAITVTVVAMKKK